MLDSIIVNVLFALDKTHSPFLWGSSQDLPGGAGGVARWMSNMCHPRHLFPCPQDQDALTDLSWELVLSGPFLMFSWSPCVFQHTDVHMETKQYWSLRSLVWLCAPCHCFFLGSHENRRWRRQVGRKSWGSAWGQDPQINPTPLHCVLCSRAEGLASWD